MAAATQSLRTGRQPDRLSRRVEQGSPRQTGGARLSGGGRRAFGQSAGEPAGLGRSGGGGPRGGASAFFPRDARQASGPGGTALVEGGNHSVARESIFPV